MKLKKLGVKGLKDILSRDELRQIVGGGTGSNCVKPCNSTPGSGEGNACVTRDCKDGKCGYGRGIWGCVTGSTGSSLLAV